MLKYYPPELLLKIADFTDLDIEDYKNLARSNIHEINHVLKNRFAIITNDKEFKTHELTFFDGFENLPLDVHSEVPSNTKHEYFFVNLNLDFPQQTYTEIIYELMNLDLKCKIIFNLYSFDLENQGEDYISRCITENIKEAIMATGFIYARDDTSFSGVAHDKVQHYFESINTKIVKIQGFYFGLREGITLGIFGAEDSVRKIQIISNPLQIRRCKIAGIKCDELETLELENIGSYGLFSEGTLYIKLTHIEMFPIPEITSICSPYETEPFEPVSYSLVNCKFPILKKLNNHCSSSPILYMDNVNFEEIEQLSIGYSDRLKIGKVTGLEKLRHFELTSPDPRFDQGLGSRLFECQGLDAPELKSVIVPKLRVWECLNLSHKTLKNLDHIKFKHVLEDSYTLVIDKKSSRIGGDNPSIITEYGPKHLPLHERRCDRRRERSPSLKCSVVRAEGDEVIAPSIDISQREDVDGPLRRTDFKSIGKVFDAIEELKRPGDHLDENSNGINYELDYENKTFYYEADPKDESSERRVYFYSIIENRRRRPRRTC